MNTKRKTPMRGDLVEMTVKTLAKLIRKLSEDERHTVGHMCR